MTDTLKLEIVSPERLLKDATAAQVVVPGSDGDFAVLPAHSPMMSTIRPGVIEIFETETSDAECLFVKGGLAQVSPEGLTLLAEEVIDLTTVDTTDLAQKIIDTREDIEDAKDDVERTGFEKELSWMLALQDVVA